MQANSARPLWLIGALLAVCVLATGAGPTFDLHTVHASALPGATYTGSHGQGGSVLFKVTADGSGIEYFEADNFTDSFCTIPSVRKTYQNPLPIQNNIFTDPASHGLRPQ